MKKLEMLISDGLNVNSSFQLFPHGGREMGGAYLTWLNFTLAALQDFSINKSFHSKVIFRCWAAFRLGHHVNKEVAPSLLLIYFYEKRGGNQVFAHQAGGVEEEEGGGFSCSRAHARVHAPRHLQHLPPSPAPPTRRPAVSPCTGCCGSRRSRLSTQGLSFMPVA